MASLDGAKGVTSDSMRSDLIRKLVQHTGITEVQALELINLIGPNWNSLVREAKILLGKR
ncbi:MAG: hypothetical protein EOS78_13225 [Mesorhizobium sp.]|nr:MAG: hypothetical protein EOS78_13225 [Mesorhizobium sp.]